MKDGWWNPKHWIETLLYKLENRELSKSEKAYLQALAEHYAKSYEIEDEEDG